MRSSDCICRKCSYFTRLVESRLALHCVSTVHTDLHVHVICTALGQNIYALSIMSSPMHRSCSAATPGYPPPAQRPQCSSIYSWDATSATLRRGVLLGPTFSPPLLCLEWFPPCWVRVTLTWRSPSPPLLSTSHRTGTFRSAIATYIVNSFSNKVAECCSYSVSH